MPVLKALLWLVYPLVILFGLKVAEPRYVALVLALALLLRRGREAARLLSSLSRVDLVVLGSLLLLAGVTAVTNSEQLLRLYPAAMNLGMLLLFGMSLIDPPSMVERFARLREPDLPDEAIRYTRCVTQVWCFFFVGNGVIAIYTALYASRDAWALYNGFFAYVLMGGLFGGEWLLRRFFAVR